MIDGYEEYGQARTRTSEPTKSNETQQVPQGSTPHVPQGFTPHSVCPGSLVTHCGVLTTLNMVARSPCNYLVQLSCRLVYALMKANPLNVVVLEAFDVIQGLYGSLAGLVAKCCKLQQKNGKILLKKNHNNEENVKSGVEKSEIASNIPSSSSIINPSISSDIIRNRIPISVNAVPNPIIQQSSNSTSNSIPTTTTNTNLNSKKNIKTEMNTNMNMDTNINSNLETEIEKENKMKAKIKMKMIHEIKNENGTYDLHAVCTDLIPLVLDLTCVLQYVAVVTSERGDYFLRFLLHLVVSMSITPSTTSSSTSFPSSSSSSSSSSTLFPTLSSITESSETKENENNNKNQKQNRNNSDGNTVKNTDSKTVIIDPGPVPLFDPLTRTLQFFPFLRTYQYSQYVTDCDIIERETVVRKGEEKSKIVIDVEVEKEIEAGIKKKMSIKNEEKGGKIVGIKKTEESKRQKEGAVVCTGEGSFVTNEIVTKDVVQEPHFDQNVRHGGTVSEVEKEVEMKEGSKVEKKVKGEVQNVGETVVDGDKVVEGEEEEKEELEVVEEEVEECHKEEVLCVLLFVLKGSIDDTIVSTACPCCCSSLLFNLIHSFAIYISSNFCHFIILSFHSFYWSNYFICFTSQHCLKFPLFNSSQSRGNYLSSLFLEPLLSSLHCTMYKPQPCVPPYAPSAHFATPSCGVRTFNAIGAFYS
jgi:hypothetical protein